MQSAEARKASKGQVRLLLWKNFLLKRRAGCSTAMEVLVPVIVVAILVVIRLAVKVDDVPLNLHLDERVPLDALTAGTLAQLVCGPPSFDSSNYLGAVGVAAAPGGADVAQRLAETIRADLRESEGNASLAIDALAAGGACGRVQPGQFDLARFVNESAVRVFDSEDSMLRYVGRKHYGESEDERPLMAGAVLSRAADAGAHQWELTVRTNFSITPDTRTIVNKFLTSFDEGEWDKYLRNGMASIQRWAADTVFSYEGAAPGARGGVTVGPFPESKGRKDVFGNAISSIIGLFLIMAFMWPFSRLVRNMVDEKERRVREGMMVMGLGNRVFWLSWALTYAVLMLAMVVLVMLISLPTLFSHSDISLMFVFWLLFAMNLISLAMLVTPFFQRAKTAGTLSMFTLVLFVMPYFAVQDPNRSASAKAFSCFLAPVAFSLGNAEVLRYESAFIGVHWNNINEVDGNFRLSTALVFLFIDFWLYLALAWYLDLVLPKEFGTRLPWHFPFHASYWCGGAGSGAAAAGSGAAGAPLLGAGGSSRRPSGYGAASAEPLLAGERTPVLMKPVLAGDGDHDDGDAAAAGGGYQGSDDLAAAVDPASAADVPTEPVPDSLAVEEAVTLRGLRKVFGGESGSVAVAGLDLSMYRGQCFVLLGHNGAGKSTTINMLTGMTDVSGGGGLIEGLDVRTEMPEIRQKLGICPQHDILWPTLSVREHLEFFARLKGVEKGAATAHAVAEAMAEVQLTPQAEQPAGSMSGGQKRRLSLAMALIADSEVVFLDEPTSGVDPYSRRAIWELIGRKKAGRVIILTTHFLDEADYVGDRIGIMHKGRLRCVGSSLFLKRTYGVGYVMTMTKKEGCDGGEVGELVRSHVGEAELLTDAAAELSFRLPLGASASFPALLRELDGGLDRLAVDNYGLSVTTLEEVFLRVSELEARAEDRERAATVTRKLTEKRAAAGEAAAAAAAAAAELRVLDAHESHRSAARDFCALFSKRARILRRDRKSAVCQFLVPIALLVFGLALLRIPPNFSFPSLEMSPAMFHPASGLPWAETGGGSEADAAALLARVPGTHVRKEHVNATDEHGFCEEILRRDQTLPERFGAYAVASGASPYNVTVLTNFTAVHAVPTFVAEILSAELRDTVGSADAGIRTYSHPWPFTELEKSAINAVNGVFAAIVIAIAYAFVPASFSVFVVKDREQQSKHMQMISGVDMRMYWLSNYAFDFLQFLVPAMIGSWVILAFTNTNVYSGENYPVVVTAFVLYGLAIIPFTYLVSFAFKSHSTAQNTMIMIYFFGGVVLLMTSFALYQISSTREANSRYIRHLFRLFPSFCISDAFFWLSVRDLPFVDLGPWALDVTGYDCIFLAVEAVVYFCMTLAVEYASSEPRIARAFGADPDLPDAGPPAGDEDVQEERRRVQATAPADEPLRVCGLRKTFPGRVAVRDLYFGVRRGEVLGFLGVNGAGKSTTLKMLTSDYLPSRGTATVGGFDLSADQARVRRLTGYCSQVDALSEYLSPREHLRFYGAIRGVPRDTVERCVSYLINRLSLGPFADRPAGKLSGGNKRKLSLAIALVGNPRVVLIDEMSSGVDATSRRALWTFISETMADRAVVLTTHSMEEAEALSSRIAIIKQGELVCFGTPQHLKHRYGRGLQLQLSTGAQPVGPACEWAQRAFPGALLLESYGNSARLRLPERSLADTFDDIERVREEHHIKEYALSGTTLEQLFLQFAQPAHSGVPVE